LVKWVLVVEVSDFAAEGELDQQVSPFSRDVRPARTALAHPNL